MSESKDLSVGHTSGDPLPRAPSRELVPVVAPPRAKFAPEPQAPPPPDRLSSSRFALAAAAAVVVVVAVAGALVWEDRQQTSILAERASETESLAQTVRSLRVRLDAIDAAKLRDDLADLRRSVGDMKTSVVSAREFNSALAQLSQRVDKLDSDESAKVSKLSERMDHEGSTLTAGFPAASTSSRRRPSRPSRRRHKSRKPSSRRSRPSSQATFRWRRQGRSSGQDRCCAAISS